MRALPRRKDSQCRRSPLHQGVARAEQPGDARDLRAPVVSPVRGERRSLCGAEPLRAGQAGAMGLGARAFRAHPEFRRHRALSPRRQDRQPLRLLRAARQSQGCYHARARSGTGAAAADARRPRAGGGAPAQARRGARRGHPFPRPSDQGCARRGDPVRARDRHPLRMQRECAARAARRLCRRTAGDRLGDCGDTRAGARARDRRALSDRRRRCARGGALGIRCAAGCATGRMGAGGPALGGAGLQRGDLPQPTRCALRVSGGVS